MAKANEFMNLENALVQAGRELEYPATPALAARVRAELARGPVRIAPAPASIFGSSRRRWLPVAFALLLALVLVLSLPATREAVAQFLGLRGLRIFYVTPSPVPTPTPSGTPTGLPVRLPGAGPTGTVTPILSRVPAAQPTARPSPTVKPNPLCCAVTLTEAQRRSLFKLLVPPGELPTQVYYQEVYDSGAQVVMVFGDPAHPRFTLYQAERWIYGKMVAQGTGEDTTISEARVRGERALWFSGGTHLVMTLNANGIPVYDTQRTVEGNTLAWEKGAMENGIIYRLETKASLQDAVRFAEALVKFAP